MEKNGEKYVSSPCSVALKKKKNLILATKRNKLKIDLKDKM